MTHSTRRHISRNVLAAAFFGAAALVTASTVSAASITWGAATTISGDLDISTHGTLVDAYTIGTSTVTGTTVNGVTFAAFGVPLSVTPSVTVGNYTLASSGNLGSANNFGSALAPFSSLSASYQSLLSEAAGGFAGQSLTLTIAGLTVGNTYEFQWWANNSDILNGPVISAAAGNSVSLDPNVVGVQGAFGQFAIGSFTADNASLQISFSTASGITFANGFQLRNITLTEPPSVPEPGTLALLGLGLAGLGLSRRRRTS